jgi:hypothetical protein
MFSCTSTSNLFNNSVIDMDVNSYSVLESNTNKDCFILPIDSNFNTSDFEYMEYKNYLTKLLIKKGYNVVDSIEKANIIVCFNYGIGNPEFHISQSVEPIWGSTSLASSTTTTNINTYSFETNTGTSLKSPFSKPYSPYSTTNTQVSDPINTYQNKTTNTTYNYNYGITGYHTVNSSYNTYTKYLNLYAIDKEQSRKLNKEKRIWQLTTISTGPSYDLRYIFPYLLVGSKNYIGVNSVQSNKIQVSINDSRVIELKQNNIITEQKSPDPIVNLFKTGDKVQFIIDVIIKDKQKKMQINDGIITRIDNEFVLIKYKYNKQTIEITKHFKDVRLTE